MLCLNFVLHRPDELRPIDYANASEMDLRYDASMGTITIDTHAGIIVIDRTSLLDYFACMRSICASLLTGSVREKYEDTESELCIEFIRAGDSVVIRSGVVEAGCGLGELIDVVNRNAARCVEEMIALRPGLRDNAGFARWYGIPQGS